MAEEKRKRRRGRRRGRGGGYLPQPGSADRPGEERPEEGQPEVTEESEAPGVLPSRLRFRFWRRRRGEEREEKAAERRREEREGRAAAGAPADVSPLAFWRRGQARTYREQPMPKQTLGRTWRRIRGMYFPPWVPVLFIILVVFGILGVLFFARGAAGRPLIGQDHWHATYQIWTCGERQPNAPSWEGGVHTHADGVIHMHPFTPAEEGTGARLVKWFEYGGGKLTQSEMRIPGSREEYKNGDTCEDGSEARLQVFVNGEKLDDWSRYLPKDGDRIRIVFGSEEEAGAEGEGIQIPPEEATREINIEAGDRGQAELDSFFSPDAFTIKTGETVKVNVDNTGSVTHNLRVEGIDHEYETEDDFVTSPPDQASTLIQPGEEGYTVVRIDEPGQYAFRCDIHRDLELGTMTVEGEAVEETAVPEENTPEAAEVTAEVAMGDSFFQPSELEVEAGQEFRISLTNDGELVHNLRIAGPDGEYDTGDDLVSTPSPLRRGETGELVGQIDEPGVYNFRSDFQESEMVGTITVK